MSQFFRVRLSLFGRQWLGSLGPLDRMLRAFEEDPLVAPDRWSLLDGTSVQYERQEILASVDPTQTAMLYLMRKESDAWESSIDLMGQSYVSLEGKFSDKNYPACLSLFERLAIAISPDFGSVGRMYFPPPIDSEGIDQNKISHCCGVAPIDYSDSGPRGLGERTFIGSNYIEQLGRPRVGSLGLPTRNGPLGSLFIDLATDPGRVPREEMLEPWRRAMAVLEPAGVFARVRVFKNGGLHWSMGENCDIGDLAVPPSGIDA